MCGDAVDMKAAATAVFVRSEVTSANLLKDFSTIATTAPSRMPIAGRAIALQNQESGKAFACNVDKRSHKNGILTLFAIGS